MASWPIGLMPHSLFHSCFPLPGLWGMVVAFLLAQGCHVRFSGENETVLGWVCLVLCCCWEAHPGYLHFLVPALLRSAQLAKKGTNEPFSFPPLAAAVRLWVPGTPSSPLGPHHCPGGMVLAGFRTCEGGMSSWSGALSAPGSLVTQTRNFGV